MRKAQHILLAAHGGYPLTVLRLLSLRGQEPAMATARRLTVARADPTGPIDRPRISLYDRTGCRQRGPKARQRRRLMDASGGPLPAPA